jgi:hypothetical protein
MNRNVPAHDEEGPRPHGNRVEMPGESDLGVANQVLDHTSSTDADEAVESEGEVLMASSGSPGS